jgi:hypothetical protein
MRVLVLRPLAFAAFGVAAVLAGRAFPQATSSAEPPEEVTVRGRKPLSQYRLELEQARDEIFKIYNEANEGNDNDITCRDEQPTGSRMRQDVCRSNAENQGDATAARGFLNALLMSSGSFVSGTRAGGASTPLAGGTQVNANAGTGAAQGAGAAAEQAALASFEAEFRRLLSEDRQLYRAVVKYAELEGEYARARGAAGAPTQQEPTVLLDALPEPSPSQPSAPLCEATTLTEYQQRNNVARVMGTVSISSCPAGTTGSFTLVARVRDDAGDTKPIEFNETWQRADAGDHTFNTDYPIGDNVELMSVRVRNLKCTCADAAP